MPEMTVVNGAVFIPEVWSKVALIERDHMLHMANRVLRKDNDVKAMGDIIHIPEVALFTANPVGAGGSINPQAPTETEATLTVDQWFESSVEITDRLKTQAMHDLFRIYSERIGKSLGVQVETSILELAQVAANFTTEATGGANVTDPRIVEAIRTIDAARAPLEKRSGIFTTGQKAQLLLIDKFVRADAIPFVKGDSPIVKGVFGDIYGVEILISTLIAQDVNNRDGDGAVDEFLNLIWQEEAMVLALQKQVDLETLARTQLSTPMVGQSLYGLTVPALRSAHATVIMTDAASG
jgi:N4-gp56 family major capsid protein